MNKQTNKIAIGIPIYGDNVKTSFFTSYIQLQKKYDYIELICRDQILDKARNKIVENAIKMKCTHLLFLDSDMTFPPTLIDDLLKHNKDIINGLCFLRKPPYRPTLYYDIDDKGGRCYKGELKGLIEVDLTGFACSLINLKIFKNIPKPWFEFKTIDGKEWSEDLIFCKKAKQSGIKIYVDCDIKCGHITDYEVKEDMYRWYNGMGKSDI
jgi:hypothetical protein